MFSLFGRRSADSESFKVRVERFWGWFSANEARFRDAIAAQQLGPISDEISAEIGRLGGLVWVAGRAGEGQDCSLTITGEGSNYRFFLADYCISLAPNIPGWTFFNARQAGSLEQMALCMGDLTIAATEIWLTPGLNEEDEKVDITLWHPAWSSLEENQRYTIVFLFLDEALGEIGTRQWIGAIDLADTQLKEAIPLTELPGHIKTVAAQKGWEKLPPGEETTLYQLNEPSPGTPRGDVISGVTLLPALISDFLEAEGRMEDPLPDSGAHLVYLSIPAEFFPVGDQVTVRGEIEDAMNDALRAAQAGRLLGGSLGSVRAYIDFLLFDEEAAKKAILQQAPKLGLPRGTRLEYFAHERRKDGYAV